MSKRGTTARQSARDKLAKGLARVIEERGRVEHNRLVSVSVTSECDTELYVIALKSTTHSPPFLLTPVIVGEEDTIYVNMSALTKGSYDRVVLRRCMREIRDYTPVTGGNIQVLARYGATGLVMGLAGRAYHPTKRGHPWEWNTQRTQPDSHEEAPTWWNAAQAALIADHTVQVAGQDLTSIIIDDALNRWV